MCVLPRDGMIYIYIYTNTTTTTTTTNNNNNNNNIYISSSSFIFLLFLRFIFDIWFTVRSIHDIFFFLTHGNYHTLC